MPIYYALVGKHCAGQNIALCEASTYVGNFDPIVKKLLPKIEPDSMKTW